jgi:3',5'-cyclic AMP phosphodiesterase CpdA
MLIAHLSDTHFTTGVLAGELAWRGHQALSRVRALDPIPDFVLITGDLTEHGDPAEYEIARELLGTLDIPVHVVPGNHDDAGVMLSVLSDTPYVQAAAGEGRCYYRVDYPGLRLLCCDSSVAGRHDGELGPAQLAWLDAELRRDPEVPAIVAMHHHAVPSGIAVMDDLMLSDSAALAAVLERHPPLVRLLCGHLHRPVTAMFAASLFMSAPSTCRQVFLDLRPGRDGAYVDEPAGFLLHVLGAGTAVSHLVPVRESGPPAGLIRS